MFVCLFLPARVRAELVTEPGKKQKTPGNAPRMRFGSVSSGNHERGAESGWKGQKNAEKRGSGEGVRLRKMKLRKTGENQEKIRGKFYMK